MWRWLFDRISRKDSLLVAPKPNQSCEKSTTTVLYAKVSLDLCADGSVDDSAADRVALKQQIPTSGSRSEAAISIASPPKDPSSATSTRSKKRKTRTLRFRRRFDEMSTTEARLLFAVHRRTVRGLASESPVALQRDLHRFILSTRGQRISRGQTAPSVTKIKSWIEAARHHATRTTSC